MRRSIITHSKGIERVDLNLIKAQWLCRARASRYEQKNECGEYSRLDTSVFWGCQADVTGHLNGISLMASRKGTVEQNSMGTLTFQSAIIGSKILRPSVNYPIE